MTNATAGFTCDTLLRKRIEKLRRKEKDVRVHNRLSAVLWLGQVGVSWLNVSTALARVFRSQSTGLARDYIEAREAGGDKVRR